MVSYKMPKVFTKNPILMNADAVLHNVFVLYFLLFLALGNLFYLVNSHNYAFAGAFILIGFITSFFSKNMVVILCIAIVATNVLQFGSYSGLEGVDETLIEEETESESPSDTKHAVSKDTKPVATKDTKPVASKDTRVDSSSEKVIENEEKTDKITKVYKELKNLQEDILNQLKKIEAPINKAESLVNVIENLKLD